MKNQRKMKWLWIAIAGLFAAIDVSAQSSNISDLKPVFDRLKSIKAYSYETLTSAVFPNGQKDQMRSYVYMDRLNKKLVYKTAQQLIMLNQQWLLQVDHKHKTASVFDVVQYDKKHKDVLPQIESVFKNDVAAVFLDSVLLKYGRLVSATKSNNLTTYKIAFKNEGAALKEMTIVYNSTTQLPDRISLKTESPVQGGKKVKSETVCSNYSTTVSQSMFDEKQYFNLVKGKPVLVQFKNYKLYSVL